MNRKVLKLRKDSNWHYPLLVKKVNPEDYLIHCAPETSKQQITRAREQLTLWHLWATGSVLVWSLHWWGFHSGVLSLFWANTVSNHAKLSKGLRMSYATSSSNVRRAKKLGSVLQSYQDSWIAWCCRWHIWNVQRPQVPASANPVLKLPAVPFDEFI